MFYYTYEKDTNHNMLLVHLAYDKFIINIVYEDYAGNNVKKLISCNLNDYNDASTNPERIKNRCIDILQDYFDDFTHLPKPPAYILEYLIVQIKKI